MFNEIVDKLNQVIALSDMKLLLSPHTYPEGSEKRRGVTGSPVFKRPSAVLRSESATQFQSSHSFNKPFS